jgi:hypothetical protein
LRFISASLSSASDSAMMVWELIPRFFARAASLDTTGCLVCGNVFHESAAIWSFGAGPELERKLKFAYRAQSHIVALRTVCPRGGFAGC